MSKIFNLQWHGSDGTHLYSCHAFFSKKQLDKWLFIIMSSDDGESVPQLSILMLRNYRYLKFYECGRSRLKTEVPKQQFPKLKSIPLFMVINLVYSASWLQTINNRWSLHIACDCIFLIAFSMAGTFFLKTDHCSSVKLIPEKQTKPMLLVWNNYSSHSNFQHRKVI